MSDRCRFPKIKDVLPIENGLFYHMDYDFSELVTNSQLDFLFLSQFAQRNPAPVIDMLHDEDEDEDNFSQLTDTELQTLADLMVGYFKPRWDKLKDIYGIEYDPIHNFLDEWEDEMEGAKSEDRSSESERVDTHDTTVAINNLRTDALQELETRNLSDGNTRTDNLSETNTGTQSNSGSNTNTSSVWGFNSSTDVNSDKDTGSNSNTRTDNLTKANTGTVTDSGTHTGSVTTANTGTVTDAGTNKTTGTESRAYTDSFQANEEQARERSGRHFGNIGNLTSQKMIKEEIELWKWSYIQEILNDAKSFLTLEVYL